MKKRFFKFISVFTVACMLSGSVDMSALAQTANEEQVVVQQAAEMDTVTVSGGEATDESLFMYEVEDGNATITRYCQDEENQIVIIPNTVGGYKVTKIGSYAFDECEGIVRIEIPEGVTSIGDSAFQGCWRLTSIIIPESVMNIGEDAFSNYSKLTIYGYTSSYAEAYADEVLTVFIPLDVLHIPATSVTLNNTELSLNKGESVSLQATMAPANTTARIRWVSSDSNVVTVSGGDVVAVGAGVANITASATSGVKAICEVTVEDPDVNVESLLVYNVDESGNATITGYTGAVVNITIPDYIDGHKVTKIGNSAFEECDSLTSIIIPDGVTDIEDYAFMGCSRLKSITLPQGLTCINNRVFFGCSRLKSITIPKGVTSIDKYAFHGSGLTSVTIPEGVTTIGENAFDKCHNLINVTMPEGLTSIGSYAFHHCEELKSITIPKGVTSIGNNAFYDCLGLTSVTISEGVTSIGNRVFGGCVGLTEITIPKSVTSIGNEAFEKFDTLTIYGYAGTYAESYANSNNAKFVRLSVPATSVTLNKTAVTIKVGESETITATILPADTTDTLMWTTSNPNVANVSDKGVVTAAGAGTATITVTATSGVKATCEVTVPEKKIKATKIKLSKTKLTLNKGKTVTLKATVTPSNTTDKIKWTTSNKKVAKVTANGKKATISGLKKGTVTITAKTDSGKKATCKITVKEIKSTKVKLNKTKVTLKKGKSITLKATMTPKNSTDTIKWSSSKKSVAKVSDKGKVTAVKKGTTTITAKTSSGKKATCKITVK